MEICVTRDSVCAADDGDAPHQRILDVPDNRTVEPIVLAVVRAYDLPQISGGDATWSISSNIPLAVVAQQWPGPRMTSPMPRNVAECDTSGNGLRLHFCYFAQLDPEVVFEVLERLRLRP
jgi:hypothetical protein